MWRGLAEIAGGAAQLVYPNSCLVCDAPEAETSSFRHGVCSACCRSMTTDAASVCRKCAATVGPHTDVSEGCPACRSHSFPFAKTIRLGPYEGRLRDAILRLKNFAGEPLAEMLGRVWVDERLPALKPCGIEVVVPVPLHWRRRWLRGYNQAASLAREIAFAIGAPCQAGWLRRIQPAPQHAQPSAAARQANIRGAFACSHRASLGSKTVLLVDDVMTTGSTAAEAAKTLKAAGASQVVVAILARA